LLFFFGSAFFLAGQTKNRFHVDPVMAGFHDNQLASAIDEAQLRGVGVGRNANGFLMNQSAALRLRWSQLDKSCQQGGRSEAKEIVAYSVGFQWMFDARLVPRVSRVKWN